MRDNMQLGEETPYVRGRQRADSCVQHVMDSVLSVTIQNSVNTTVTSAPIPCYVPESLHQFHLLTHVVYQYVQQ